MCNSTADRRAAGVDYFTVGIEGFTKPMFRCKPWSANLGVDFCERRWRQAQAARGEEAERMAKCRTCQIGAAHAGERAVYRSELFGASICPRCGRGTTRRLIGNRLDINCYNRQLEVMRGRNAKGRPPEKLKLRKVRLGVVLDADTPERRVVVYEDWAADVEIEPGRWAPGFEELMTQVLRTTEGRVNFVAAPDDAPTWTPPKPPRPPCGAKTPPSAYL
jgi:hypothetical protein